MARLPGSRPRLLAALLSVAAHLLLLAPLALWRGATTPRRSQVLDTRVRVSLAEPPSLQESSETGPGEGDRIDFDTHLSPQKADSSDHPEEGPTIRSPGPSMSLQLPGAGPAGRGKPGKGTGLLAAPGAARRVVYVLDRSLSMGEGDALAAAGREVLASMQSLPAGARFQVIAYNEQAEPLRLGGTAGLLPAEPAVLDQVARFLDTLLAAGESRHVPALQRALVLQPDLLFFVTDADELTLSEVQLITRLNRGRAVIHTVELSKRRPRPDGPLGQLAAANGGTYRCSSPGP